ncbi:MAG: hypothetical protein ACO25L_06965 [Candidatus Nanopelagicales bacterium]|jgi:hypothetical protein
MPLHNPAQFINGYLQDKITEFGIGVPFFPTRPTDATTFDTLTIDVLTEQDGTQQFEAQYLPTNGVVAVYDRMFKMRRSPFPHIKCEQLMYYFYATSQDAIPYILEIAQKVQDELDGTDESAQAVNTWAKLKQESQTPLLDLNGNPLELPFFHDIKVYQLEETRDIIDFGTARTFAGNKIIIDYDWHKS